MRAREAPRGPSWDFSKISNHTNEHASASAEALAAEASAKGSDHDDNELHRHAAGPGPGVAPPIVHEVLQGPGQAIPADVRRDMEARFGHDFANVRVHTDERAGASAEAVAAHAYTVGRHIVFAPGRFDPLSAEGRRLLAHELVHAAGHPPGAPALSAPACRRHA